jgi:tyrosyl-tRNA synthetase
VWLAPDMMTPYAFYQFWVNADDADVVRFLKIFTFRTREEIAELERAVQERPAAREAQRTLASDVTTLVHGEEATKAVIAASQALFGRGDLAELDEATLAAAVAELPRVDVAPGTPVVEALAGAGLVAGRSAARRAIAEGGAYVNNAKVAGEDAILEQADLLHGRYALLRRGKRTLALAVVDETAARAHS